MKKVLRFLNTSTAGILRFLSGETLPDLSAYDIERRPRRNVKVKEDRRAEGNVVDGKEYVERPVENEPNIFETVRANSRPETPNEVVLDGYDIAYLDDVVGTKWRKDESRAKVIKWYWLQKFSAAQIEAAKTDKRTKKLEKGFSERTVAEFIKAFYDADDGREKDGKPRLRASRLADADDDDRPQEPPGIIIEW